MEAQLVDEARVERLADDVAAAYDHDGTIRLQRELGMRVTFVSDLAAAIDQARAAASQASAGA